jgi:hypothetical protein
MSGISNRPLTEDEVDVIASLLSLPVSGTNQGISKVGSTSFDNTTFSGGGGGSGTVSSVAMSVPAGLTISGSPITTLGTLALGLDTGYVIPLQTTLDSYSVKSGALTQFIGNGNWKVWYSDGNGDVQELALGANGTFLKSNGAAAAPTFVTPVGSGDMVLADAQTNSGIKTFLDTTMKLRNVANTFDGYFVNTNTADRIYTLPNLAGTIALGTGTINELSYWVDGNTLGALTVATYPSLTELSYVKGVTSAIQTQIGTKANTATTITINGTANQITSSAGAQDLSANRTWTLSLPADVLIPTVLTIPNTGLHILDTNATHDLIIAAGSNLTADHTLTLTTGDADVILNLTAVTDEYVLAYDTGTNTWRGVAAATGTVTTVSVVSANGFAGTVATDTTTPAITLTTSITGVLKGNGTAISAATAGSDYVVGSIGLAGGQTIAGSTLTLENLTLRANAADLTTGAVIISSSKEATSSTVGSVQLAGGLAVAKRVYALDMTVTNTITGSISGNAGSVTGFTAGAGILTGPANAGVAVTLGNTEVITGVKTMSGLNVILVSSSGLTIRNPADTFKYTITAAAIAADRILNLPLITATDTLGALGLAQTWTAVQTFVAPVLGAASATSINGNFFTTGTYTLTGVAGKTLTFNKSITLEGTDSTTMTFPTTSATIARTDTDQTFTGIQTFSTPIATGSVATMSATVGGGVPTPPNNTTTFLRGDGTFAAPTGGTGIGLGLAVASIQGFNLL